MRFLVLTALVAVSLAALPKPEDAWFDEYLPEAEQKLSEDVFRAGREYRFHYNAQLSTGVPMASKQHAANRIQALVSVVFKTPDTCLLELSQIRFGKLNRRLPEPRRINPFHSFEEVEVREELIEALKKPLSFKWNQGLISELVFDGSEQSWSANIKRGVLNMLQVNLRRAEPVFPMKSLRTSEKEDFFRVTESVLGGRCQVSYSVIPQEPEFLKVTKTVDFESCEKRPDIRYNFRFTTPCATCEDTKYSEEEKFLKSSVVTNYWIKGTPESFSILKTETESQYTVVPFDAESNVILTTVAQKLELVRSGSIKRQIPQPRNPVPSQTDMIYSPDWDVLKEKFHMEGEETFLNESPFSSVNDKIELVERLIRDFLRTMKESVSEETPRYFIRIVKIFRMLKKNELETVYDTFYARRPERMTPEEHVKSKQIVIDACASAATKDCVELIVDKILSKKVSPVVGYLAIKGLHTRVRTVSEQMINQLFRLAKSPVARRYRLIRSASLLAAGSMINSLCEVNDDKLAVEFQIPNPKQKFCPRTLEERYSQILFGGLKEAKTPEEKVMYVKVISNAALRSFLPQLKEIIYNPETPNYLRMECILALRQYVISAPHHVRKMLMPIFMDSNKASPLRVAALYQILETQPMRPILDQISKKVAEDKSRQVASFYITYMHSMANSTLPCTRRFANDIKLSLRHSSFHPHSFNIGQTKLYNVPFYFPSHKFGFNFRFAQQFSKYGSLPRRLYFAFDPLFGGFWSKNFITFEAHAEGSSGLERLLYKYLGDAGYLFEKRPEEILRRSPRSVSNPLNELKKLFSGLKTESRRPSTFDFESKMPRGHLSMIFRNQEYAYLPFNVENLKESVQEMIEEGSFDVRQIEQILESGYFMNIFKAFYLHEMSYKIPTSMGLPLRFSAVAPVVVKVTGKAKGSITPENSIKNIKLYLDNLKPSVAMSLIFNVESWSPVVNTGFKLVSTIKAYTPQKQLRAEINWPRKEIVLAMKPMQIRRQLTLVAVETLPITYTLVWPRSLNRWVQKEQKTIMAEEWSRMEKVDTEFGEQAIGYKLRLAARWHRTPTMKAATTPFCPFSGPNRFVITSEEAPEKPTEVILRVTGDFFKALKNLRPKLNEFESVLRRPVRPEPFGNEGEKEEMSELFEEMNEFDRYTSEDEQFNYKSYKSYQPEAGKMHVIKAILSTKGQLNRKCEFETRFRYDANLRYFNFESNLLVHPVPEIGMTKRYEATLEGETLFPETPYSFEQLIGKKHLSSLRLTFGPSDRRSKIQMKLVAERTTAQTEFSRRSPYWKLFSDNELNTKLCKDKSLCSPIVEREQMLPHLTPHSLRVSVDYENLPMPVRSFFNQINRHVKYYFFYNTIVRQVGVSNPENRIRATFTLDPLTKQYINCSIMTPTEALFFRDIPMPMPIAPVSRRIEDSFGPVYQPRPVCSVSSQRVETFDSVEYATPISPCWTVLSKDCGIKEEPNFAVLAKKKSESSELKIVKILTESHKIELIPQSEEYDTLKIKINGNPISIESFEPIQEHEHDIIRVEKEGKLVRVELPEVGVTVFFDGYTANIKVAEMYRNELCGLCGNANREVEDEFYTPEMKPTEDVRQFIRSYTVSEPSCKVPEIEDICETEECEYTPFWEETPEIDTEEEIESSQRPILKTRVIEQLDQICFSKVPVPQCPLNTYPSELKGTKKIAYTCMDSSDLKAHEYRSRVFENDEYLGNLRKMKSSFTEVEEMPKSCIVY